MRFASHPIIKSLLVAVVLAAVAVLGAMPSGAAANEANAAPEAGQFTRVYLPMVARGGQQPANSPGDTPVLAATPAQLEEAFRAMSEARVEAGCPALVRDSELDRIAFRLQRGETLRPDDIRGALGPDDEPTVVGYYTPGAPLPPTLLDCAGEPRTLDEGPLMRGGLTPSDPSAATPDRWFITVDR